MSDHTSAEVFSQIFELLAKEGGIIDRPTLLRKVHAISKVYDFNESQLSWEAQEILTNYGIWDAEEDEPCKRCGHERYLHDMDGCEEILSEHDGSTRGRCPCKRFKK